MEVVGLPEFLGCIRSVIKTNRDDADLDAFLQRLEVEHAFAAMRAARIHIPDSDVELWATCESWVGICLIAMSDIVNIQTKDGSVGTNSIANMLRSAREERAMTLVVLARRTGIAQSNLSMIETGRTDPRWSTVVRILRGLGMESPDLSQRATTPGAMGTDPWARLKRKAEHGEDVRDEVVALASNTARRARK